MLMNTTFLEDSFLIKWQSRGEVLVQFGKSVIDRVLEAVCQLNIPACDCNFHDDQPLLTKI